MSLISEFKDFAIKGNMIDIAVGIIMGAAFGTVISSLVNDVIMPPIGVALGNVDFSNPGPTLKAAGPDGKGAVIWSVGKFINAIISFLIISGAVFMLVKAVNHAKAMVAKPAAPAAPAAPPRAEVLLEQIRDALTKK